MIILDVLKFGFIYGCFIGLISLGFSLIYNILHVVDFAHTDRMVFCGYVYVTVVSFSNQFTALILSLIFGILFSLSSEVLLYRRIRKRNPSLLLLSTFGLSIVLQNVMALFFGDNLTEYPISENITTHSSLYIREYVLIPVLLLSLLSLFFWLKKTKSGISVRAMISNLERAKTLGIPINFLYSIIFAISGLLAAVGGVYLSMGFGLTPYSGFKIMVFAFSSCLIAGLDNIFGSVIVGICIGIMLSLFEFEFNALSAEALTLLLLVMILFIKPKGLFGRLFRIV